MTVDDQTRHSADADHVLNALRSLGSSVDVYDGGDGDPLGPDLDAVSRRTDVLGKLAATLSETLSCSDAPSPSPNCCLEWSCSQTASISTSITKLADATSQRSISSPMCSRGERALWWFAADNRSPSQQQLTVAQYVPATPTNDARLHVRQIMHMAGAADGKQALTTSSSQPDAPVPAVHDVSDAGTVLLDDFRSDCVIMCSVSGPNFQIPPAQQSGPDSPCQNQPQTKLSLSAHPELPVYTSQDCNQLSPTQRMPQSDQRIGTAPHDGSYAPEPSFAEGLARWPGSDVGRDGAAAMDTADPSIARPAAAAAGDGPQSAADRSCEWEDDDQCIMHMHGTSDAATCRLCLADGRDVDVVFGGGWFAYAAAHATSEAAAAAQRDGTRRSHGPGDEPAGERLPALLCWAVPCCDGRGAGGDAAGRMAGVGADAVCALVDTGAGAHGAVTAVDVMAAGTGDAVVAFVTSAGRLLLWRLSFGPVADCGTAAVDPGCADGPAGAAAAAVACHRCELLTEVPALPPGAVVAHHAWPLPQAHAMHAICWTVQGGPLRVALSAVVAKEHSTRCAPVCDALARYAVHAVPCADIGDVTAAAAGRGFVVVGAATGAVAVWDCGSGGAPPARVAGWCLEGQSVSAVTLAVQDSGLQVLVAMASGDVFNFDTGL